MSDMDRFKKLADVMELLAGNVATAEEALAMAKEAHRKVEQEDLPMLMKECGVELFKLDDGRIISVVDEVQVGVTEVNKPAAWQWLHNNGFGGLLKTQITIEFAKGEAEEAKAAAAIISDAGYTGIVSEGVHPATLKAFVKEQRQAGQDVPTDIFNIHPFSRAKIKRK
jgi:hypothetical protein